MEDMRAPADELMTCLAEATSGLLFPSESDYPLTPFRWRPGAAGEDPTPESIVRSEGLAAGTVAEAISVDDFFAPVLEEQEGDDGSDGSDAKRYRALLDLLKAKLSDLRALRVGSINIDVYILGRHASGEWIGLKTHLVET